jgi:phospholipid/cholesterol/gamma-HCH transport system substrate-binding protein
VTTEAKVGAFVLGCVAILAVAVVYLLNEQMSRGTVPYKTYLRYAGGLEPGTSVLFGGIDVGKIKAVHPAKADPTKIEILLDVKDGTPVNEKSVAKLGSVGLTSGAVLSISTGSNDAQRLPPGSSIPSQEAASIDEIAGKMAVVADNANGLITQARGELEGITRDAHTLLANLNSVTGKPTQRKIQAVLDNVNGMLATERPKIDRLTDELNTLSQHADATIQNVNGTVEDAREPLRKDLTELQITLQQAKALLGDVQVVVRANDYRIDDTIENLRVATDNLDQLTDSLKQRPWSLIRIKQPQERKVPKTKVDGEALQNK